MAAFSGPVNLYIRPGYRFRAVDTLITNFHLPKSSLLMLVASFIAQAHPDDVDAGRRILLDAYEVAKQAGYRFFSFGDAMLIKKKRRPHHGDGAFVEMLQDLVQSGANESLKCGVSTPLCGADPVDPHEGVLTPQDIWTLFSLRVLVSSRHRRACGRRGVDRLSVRHTAHFGYVFEAAFLKPMFHLGQDVGDRLPPRK
ncbi:MAG: S-adenosylmethionine:tRNA ribosyltransferase-isomerase [Caldilineaceae bacterium]